jgi:hypothetical protein
MPEEAAGRGAGRSGRRLRRSTGKELDEVAEEAFQGTATTRCRPQSQRLLGEGLRTPQTVVSFQTITGAEEAVAK